MIINIHGFGGEGNNSKYKWLCENVPRHDIYSPTFNYAVEDPKDILDHLLDTVYALHEENPGNSIYVVGNSMGGFFARRVNQICPVVTALLVNPSLAPFLTLREHLSIATCRGYLDLLARFGCEDGYADRECLFIGFDDNEDLEQFDYGIDNLDNLHVIIGDSDETINHEILTKPLLPKYFKNLHTIRGGTHRLEMTAEVENIFKTVIKTPEGRTQPVHHHGAKIYRKPARRSQHAGIA
jgi:hypothetical protein